MSPLARACRLLLHRGGDVVAPPGSEAALALLVGLSGLLVGLAMPTQIALVNLARVLITDGAKAFVSTLQALPRPGYALVAVAISLVLAVVTLSGGWISTALAAARDQPIREETRREGQRRAPRILGWNVVLIAWLGLVGLVGGEVGFVAIRSGLTASRSGDLLVPSLMGIAGLALWAFTLGAAVYYLAVSCLGAIVAVAEPQTAFWTLFTRSPRLFMAAAGWRGVRELAFLLCGWWVFKAGCTQLLLPFAPMSAGARSMTFGIAGSLFQAGLTLGDGIVLILVVLMGAVVYQDAAAQLDPPVRDAGGRQRQGSLKPWLPSR